MLVDMTGKNNHDHGPSRTSIWDFLDPVECFEILYNNIHNVGNIFIMVRTKKFPTPGQSIIPLPPLKTYIRKSKKKVHQPPALPPVITTYHNCCEKFCQALYVKLNLSSEGGVPKITFCSNIVNSFIICSIIGFVLFVLTWVRPATPGSDNDGSDDDHNGGEGAGHFSNSMEAFQAFQAWAKKPFPEPSRGVRVVKKEGGGGKGTWGKLLYTDGETHIDRNDPNYYSGEEPYQLVEATVADPLDEYKKTIASIIEEYFTTNDVGQAASDVRELSSIQYHPYFMKCLVSMAVDRHDTEKEMASVLLSARAKKALPESSKGVLVIQTAEKSYLSAPHHAELVERRWGGSTHITVEEVKKKISGLLREYVESGDTLVACRCIRELGVSFYHYEVVKNALFLGMETRTAEPLITKLLKEAAEEGIISSSQMSKGFSRFALSLDDLVHDIPSAKSFFQS
ncbi:hypothetical protein ACLB2K_048457 [Fragaria x ananassa]